MNTKVAPNCHPGRQLRPTRWAGAGWGDTPELWSCHPFCLLTYHHSFLLSCHPVLVCTLLMETRHQELVWGGKGVRHRWEVRKCALGCCSLSGTFFNAWKTSLYNTVGRKPKVAINIIHPPPLGKQRPFPWLNHRIFVFVPCAFSHRNLLQPIPLVSVPGWVLVP